MLSDSFSSADYLDVAAMALQAQRAMQNRALPELAVSSRPNIIERLLSAGVSVKVTASLASTDQYYEGRTFQIVAAPSATRAGWAPIAPKVHIRFNSVSTAAEEILAPSKSEHVQMATAHADLQRISSLRPGWDGEGADVPSPSTIFIAQMLLARLSHVKGEWSVTLHADGRPILERYADAAYDEIVISPDGGLSVWSERNGVGSSRALSAENVLTHFDTSV